MNSYIVSREGLSVPSDQTQSLPHSTSSEQALTGVEGTGLEFGGATLRLRSGQVATLRLYDHP